MQATEFDPEFDKSLRSSVLFEDTEFEEVISLLLLDHRQDQQDQQPSNTLDNTELEEVISLSLLDHQQDQQDQQPSNTAAYAQITHFTDPINIQTKTPAATNPNTTQQKDTSYLTQTGLPNVYFRTTFCGVYWRNTNQNSVSFPRAPGTNHSSYLKWLQSIPPNDRKQQEKDLKKLKRNFVTVDVTDCCGTSSSNDLVVLGMLQRGDLNHPFAINSKIQAQQLAKYITDHPGTLQATLKTVVASSIEEQGKTTKNNDDDEERTVVVAEIHPTSWKYSQKLHKTYNKQQIKTPAIHDLNQVQKAGMERFTVMRVVVFKKNSEDDGEAMYSCVSCLTSPLFLVGSSRHMRRLLQASNTSSSTALSTASSSASSAASSTSSSTASSTSSSISSSVSSSTSSDTSSGTSSSSTSSSSDASSSNGSNGNSSNSEIEWEDEDDDSIRSVRKAIAKPTTTTHRRKRARIMGDDGDVDVAEQQPAAIEYLHSPVVHAEGVLREGDEGYYCSPRHLHDRLLSLSGEKGKEEKQDGDQDKEQKLKEEIFEQPALESIEEGRAPTALLYTASKCGKEEHPATTNVFFGFSSSIQLLLLVLSCVVKVTTWRTTLAGYCFTVFTLFEYGLSSTNKIPSTNKIDSKWLNRKVLRLLFLFVFFYRNPERVIHIANNTCQSGLYTTNRMSYMSALHWNKNITNNILLQKVLHNDFDLWFDNHNNTENIADSTCNEVPVQSYVYEYVRLAYAPFMILYFQLLKDNDSVWKYSRILLFAHLIESLRLQIVMHIMTGAGGYTYLIFGCGHLLLFLETMMDCCKRNRGKI